jgi:predicted secreted protein
MAEWRQKMCRRSLFRDSPLVALLALLWSLGLAPVLQAQNQLSLGELQAGQLALNLSVTEQQQVEQDTLNAYLVFGVQGRDKTALQNEVNAAMSKALDLLRAYPAINARTSHYQVYVVQSGRPTRTDVSDPVFRAQQGVNLEGTDSATLLDLTGQLQEAGFALNGLHYSLSADAHERVAGELLAVALTKLQVRADGAAITLGKKRADLVEVSMDGSPNFMQMRQRGGMETMAMAADAAFSAPVAEPGETTISVSVSARAVLSP